MIVTVMVMVALPLAIAISGQVRTDDEARLLAGAIDIHVHSDPDSRARSIDAIDVAKLARAKAMRGIVLKNHDDPTGGLAYIVRKEVPGLEVFGGVALNLAVGGINPVAVQHMTEVSGGWGRIVWMPTYDAENHVRTGNENRPFVSVSRNGELLPEVKQVIGLIAKNGLVLATGHSSPAEGLMLVREGRRQGVQHMVVTHATFTPVFMNVDQMKEAARDGAFIEFAGGSVGGPAARREWTVLPTQSGKSDRNSASSPPTWASVAIHNLQTGSAHYSWRCAREDSRNSKWNAWQNKIRQNFSDFERISFVNGFCKMIAGMPPYCRRGL